MRCEKLGIFSVKGTTPPFALAPPKAPLPLFEVVSTDDPG